MPTPPSADKAAPARERLAARARRASNLRRRVMAGALASFAIAWGVIAFDGSMGVTAQTTTTTASTQTASSSASTESSDTPSSSSDPVTTAQS